MFKEMPAWQDFLSFPVLLNPALVLIGAVLDSPKAWGDQTGELFPPIYVSVIVFALIILAWYVGADQKKRSRIAELAQTLRDRAHVERYDEIRYQTKIILSQFERQQTEKSEAYLTDPSINMKHLSVDELRSRTIYFAVKLREYDRDYDASHPHPFLDNAYFLMSTEKKQAAFHTNTQRLVKQYQERNADFSLRFLRECCSLARELLRRLDRDPPNFNLPPIPEQHHGASIVHTGHLCGARPVHEAANYIEELACEL
jgi:hypothetical protein